MECTFNDPTIFKKIITIMTNHSDEQITLLYDKSGLKATYMNKTCVTTTIITLNVNLFKKYKCESDKIGQLTLSSEGLKKKIKTLTKDDKISLKYNNNNVLNLVIENNNGLKTYQLKLLHIEGIDEPLSIPDVEYSNKLSIENDCLINAIKDIEVMDGDDVNICLKDGLLQFSSEDDYGMFEWSPESDKIEHISYEEDVDMVVCSKFLSDIIKMVDVSTDNVIIMLDPNPCYPLRFQFEIKGSDDEIKSSIEYFIAKRVID
jgi:proliferating cell nuclear antigen PCNA